MSHRQPPLSDVIHKTAKTGPDLFVSDFLEMFDGWRIWWWDVGRWISARPDPCWIHTDGPPLRSRPHRDQRCLLSLPGTPCQTGPNAVWTFRVYGCWYLLHAHDQSFPPEPRCRSERAGDLPRFHVSLCRMLFLTQRVLREARSLTHSCTHSLILREFNVDTLVLTFTRRGRH